VASSASREESEDFFGKQIKAEGGQEENMKRKIMRENEEQIKKKLTSESYASLMSRSPGVAYPCPWRWGILLWRQGKI
jgi:hypothetical protein